MTWVSIGTYKVLRYDHSNTIEDDLKYAVAQLKVRGLALEPEEGPMKLHSWEKILQMSRFDMSTCCISTYSKWEASSVTLRLAVLHDHSPI